MSIVDDIDPAFDRMFLDLCERVGCSPVDLLGVMSSESNIKASAFNPNGGASGLIQFMPDTLRWLGWKDTPQHFRMLPASHQLRFVEAYIKSFAKDAGTWDSAGRIYQAVFLPGTLSTSRAPEDVIAQHGGRLGWAYDANKVFDTNGDACITIQELTDSVHRASLTARYAAMLGRLGLADTQIVLSNAAEAADPLRVESVLDVQYALNRLMPDAALSEDGLDGPKTQAAVRAFQAQSGLHVDGIAGKDTRAALRARLKDAARLDG